MKNRHDIHYFLNFHQIDELFDLKGTHGIETC